MIETTFLSLFFPLFSLVFFGPQPGTPGGPFGPWLSKPRELFRFEKKIATHT